MLKWVGELIAALIDKNQYIQIQLDNIVAA